MLRIWVRKSSTRRSSATSMTSRWEAPWQMAPVQILHHRLVTNSSLFWKWRIGLLSSTLTSSMKTTKNKQSLPACSKLNSSWTRIDKWSRWVKTVRLCTKPKLCLQRPRSLMLNRSSNQLLHSLLRLYHLIEDTHYQNVYQISSSNKKHPVVRQLCYPSQVHSISNASRQHKNSLGPLVASP